MAAKSKQKLGQNKLITFKINAYYFIPVRMVGLNNEATKLRYPDAVLFSELVPGFFLLRLTELFRETVARLDKWGHVRQCRLCNLVSVMRDNPKASDCALPL